MSMPEATTTAAVAPADPAITPLECLFDSIFVYLLPIFLVSAGGDIRLARQSVIDLLDAYQAATAAELVLVAQIISFSHAAMDSLSQSMPPDLPERLVLRFRTNAAALNRSAEQCRKSLAAMQANRPEAGRSLGEPWCADLSSVEPRPASPLPSDPAAAEPVAAPPAASEPVCAGPVFAGPAPGHRDVEEAQMQVLQSQCLATASPSPDSPRRTHRPVAVARSAPGSGVLPHDALLPEALVSLVGIPPGLMSLKPFRSHPPGG